MRFIIIAFVLFFSCVSLSLVGGTNTNADAIKTALGLNSLSYVSQRDMPEIPIGPRVAITCGHCAAENGGLFGSYDSDYQVVYPPQMQAFTQQTGEVESGLPAGTYGLSLFEKANYSYDLALVILNGDGGYFGPYMTIAKDRVQIQEVLTFVGQDMSSSSTDFCGGQSGSFAYAPFHVVDLYSQNVGFILTGKPAATCDRDSGGYYFRTLPNGTIQLAGINSWGTENGLTETSTYGVKRTYQGYLSGANDLTSPGVRNWLSQVAAQYKLDICGLNKNCPPVKSPFAKSLGQGQRM